MARAMPEVIFLAVIHKFNKNDFLPTNNPIYPQRNAKNNKKRHVFQRFPFYSSLHVSIFFVPMSVTHTPVFTIVQFCLSPF